MYNEIRGNCEPFYFYLLKFFMIKMLFLNFHIIHKVLVRNIMLANTQATFG